VSGTWSLRLPPIRGSAPDLDEAEVSGTWSWRPPPTGGSAPDLDEDEVSGTWPPIRGSAPDLDDDVVFCTWSLRLPPIRGNAPDLVVSGTMPAPRNDGAVLGEAGVEEGSDRADWHRRAAAKAKAEIDFMVQFVLSCILAGLFCAREVGRVSGVGERRGLDLVVSHVVRDLVCWRDILSAASTGTDGTSASRPDK
jgi:hypothetical protein